MKSISAVKKAIFSLVGTQNAYKGAIEELPVSAEVGGSLIIDREIVKCHFVINHNNAEVHIMWEDYGYKAYKALGLYGTMNTDWQTFRTPREGVLEINDQKSGYKIQIVYES